MVEGVAHGGRDGGGNYARKLDLRTHPSAVEEGLVLCVGGRGSDEGSIGNDCARIYGSELHGEGGCVFCASLVTSCSLVGSIKPSKLLFNQTRLWFNYFVSIGHSPKMPDAWV